MRLLKSKWQKFLLGLCGVAAIVAWVVYDMSCPLPVAHVYIDVASTPTLFQMIDLVKQPKDEPKYALWRRYVHPLSQQFLNSINLQRSALHTQVMNNEAKKIIKRELREFYDKNPGHLFVIHANMLHNWAVSAVLEVIPRNRIQMLYLYEDSVAHTLWRPWNKRDENYVKLYPTIYRVTFMNRVHREFPRLRNKLYMEEMNFRTAVKLEPEQKDILYKLVGFDEKLFVDLFKNKPVGIFLDELDMDADKVTTYWENMLKNNAELQNIQWIYKNHPRGSKFGPSYEKLAKIVPNIQAVSEKIPFEIMLIAGFAPDYVFGYSSSVFFSLDKKQVVGYVERPNDLYLPILKDLGIIDRSNLITPEKLDKL